MILCWTSLALAGGVAGTSVPSSGGAFAGPTEIGALGLLSHPGAAARGEAPELMIDFGAFHQDLLFDLDAWQAPKRTQEWAPQPAMAVSVPLGPVGLGAAVSVPYTRGGDDDPQGEQRFFTISGVFQLVVADVGAGVALGRHLVLGAGARIGNMSYASEKALDTGSQLNAALAPDPPLPVGDPLLEGRQQVDLQSRWSGSYSLGASLLLPRDIEVHATFRPTWRMTLTGDVEQAPSVDLNTVVAGNADVGIAFPSHLMLAARIPIGPITLLPEVEYVGWRAAGFAAVDLSNLSLTSSDPLFDALLISSGLAEADFVKANEGPSVTDLSWQNIWIPGMQVQFAPSPRVDLRAGAWYGPGAVPDTVVTPSNTDYASTTVRLAGAWRPPIGSGDGPLRFALGVDRIWGKTRTITDSPFSLAAPEDPQPSGNGTYALDLWRLGFTTQLFLLPREHR